MTHEDTLGALLVATATGDRAAFAELYRRSSDRFYAIACRIMGSESHAQDVLQDAYLRVWRKAAQFDPSRGPASAWLAGIFRHACIDRLRREQRFRARDLEVGLLTEARLSAPEFRALDIGRCFGRLSDAERTAIYLAACQGFSHSEISRSLGWPPGTVKSHIRRGLLKLRHCLENDEGEMLLRSAPDMTHG
jgi:RNA polymerase sigma-70 factor (ECF subfamily)